MPSITSFRSRYYDALLETPAGRKPRKRNARHSGFGPMSICGFVSSNPFRTYTQVLSHGLPPMERLWGPDKSPEMAKIGNDGLADVVGQHPNISSAGRRCCR